MGVLRLNHATEFIEKVTGVQIARSYAKDMTGDEFTCHDESGEEYYAIKISHPHTWRVANGPFTTGGDVSERRKGDKQ